jgi:hypothetical protein
MAEIFFGIIAPFLDQGGDAAPPRFVPGVWPLGAEPAVERPG